MATLEENVAKVVAAHADIKAALAAKGAEVGDGFRLSNAAALIAGISGLGVDAGGLYSDVEYVES